MTVLIHNLWNAWPTKILMSFFSSLDNLLWYAYYIGFFSPKSCMFIILRQSTKHANFWLGVQFPLKRIWSKLPIIIWCLFWCGWVLLGNSRSSDLCRYDLSEFFFTCVLAFHIGKNNVVFPDPASALTFSHCLDLWQKYTKEQQNRTCRKKIRLLWNSSLLWANSVSLCLCTLDVRNLNIGLQQF